MKLADYLKENPDAEYELIDGVPVIQPPKSVRWKPKTNLPYWSIDIGGKPFRSLWHDEDLNQEQYSIGNVFPSREDAAFMAEALKVHCELLDAGGTTEHAPKKHFIYYDVKEKQLMTAEVSSLRLMWEIYFPSEEAAKEAIKKVGEKRLIRYLFKG